MRVRLERDLAAERALEIREHGFFLFLERACDFGIHAQHHAVAVQLVADLFHLGEDFVADCRRRFDHAGARAIRARLGQYPLEALLHPLACEDHEAEVGDLQDL